MIQSEYPDLGTGKEFINTLKITAIILVVAGMIICGLLFALKASDPEHQKPNTQYEKVINPKSTPDHFLDGKIN